MITYNNQRELLTQKYLEDCVYHENGHRFTVNRELINFLTSLKAMELIEDVVILDDFNNPYMIENVLEFLDKIFQIYVQSSNEYYNNYSKIKKLRSIGKITEVNE
jgi:hypothetical protein